MLEHRKPFDSPPQLGAGYLADQPGLRVIVSAAAVLLLQSTSESTLQEALTSEVGLQLPAPQFASTRGEYALLWLSPAEWLLELPANKIDSVQIALLRRLATSLAVVTNMSDAFASCEIVGPRAAEILMSGCSLDLSSEVFPADRVARTALADIPAIIWNPGEPQRLRCFVDRSFAAHLWNWLADMTQNQRGASCIIKNPLGEK